MHALYYVCSFAWNDMVHSCMVYSEHAEMAAVSCGTSHASAVSTPLWCRLKKCAIKTIHSYRITCEHSESAQERRIVLYKSDHHHHHNHHYHQVLDCIFNKGSQGSQIKNSVFNTNPSHAIGHFPQCCFWSILELLPLGLGKPSMPSTVDVMCAVFLECGLWESYFFSIIFLNEELV